MIAVFNGIVVKDEVKNILIQNVVIDMNRAAWPVVPKNHTFHCAIIAQGNYSYETGPTAPPVEGLRIVGCKIKNTHHRGVGFYSVIHSGVYECQIENTAAEGIDFDHFSYHCEAVGNTLADCHNIELNDASHCLVARNQITRPAVGIVVWQYCKLPGLNERNLILNNEIIDSKSDGISLRQGSSQNTVQGNVVKNSAKTGILVEGENNLIVRNIVSGSKNEEVMVGGKGNVHLP
jgi:parallel beta-helix repeat protein